jgi:hypothetical protein
VVPQAEVFAGELRAEAPEAAITFTLPAELAGGTSRLEVRLAPSLPAALADAYGSLAGPDAGVSGTVEAATSRVLAGATLTEVVPGDRRAADVAQGLQQLYAAQDADGRWRAWRDGAPGADTPGGDGADAYQTGYAILALAAARDAGLVVDEGVLAEGEAALARLLPEAAPEVQAWGAYALLSAGAPLSPTLSPGDGRDLGPAPQAALALALDAMGEVEEAASLVDLLYTSALTEAGRVHWQAGGTAWAGQAMRSPVAETALVLHALAQLDPASDLLAGGARWLMAQRRGQGWATPHETALALVALSDYLAVAAPEAGEAAYRLSLNGELWDEGALSAGTLHTAVVTYTEAVSPALLLPGENVLRVALDGDEVVPAGPLYYAVIWAAYLPADGVEPASDAAGSGMARGHRLP